MNAFKGTLRLYLWLVGLGTILLTVFMFVLAHPLVRILFQRGAFSSEDTNRTANTMIGYVVGLIPLSFNYILIKALNVLNRNRALLYVSIFSVAANAVFDYIFARYWQSFGIALATSAVYFCTASIRFFLLRRTIGKLHFFTTPEEIVQMIGEIRRYFQRFRRKIFPNSSGLLHDIHRYIVYTSIALVAFATGIVGIFVNTVYTLRVALGSVVVLVLLRYRYALLIAWAVIGVLVGTALPIFNGNNLDTGLVAPTLLLMAYFPVKQTFQRMPVLVFFLAYLVWVFAGIKISSAVIGLGPFLTEWTLLLAYVALATLTINVLTTRKRMLLLIDAMLLVSTCISLYGFYGFITKQNGFVDKTFTFLFRIGSVFKDSPTALAFFLSIIIPLAIHRVSTLRGYKNACGWIVVLILLAGLGLTFTRGAYIGVILSIVIMMLYLPSRKMKIAILRGILVLSVTIMLMAAIYGLPIFDRFFNQDITTLNGRVYLWQALLANFDPSQLLGKGFSASNILLASLTNLDVGSKGAISNAPHDLFLGALYDHGIIGMILLILVFIALIVNLILGIRRATGEHRTLFVTVLAIALSVSLQSLATTNLWSQSMSVYFWIIMALPFALCWPPMKQSLATNEKLFDEDARIEAMQRVGQGEFGHI
jgi:O-antigen ligase